MPACWGDRVHVHSDDEEHEDGLALVYAGMPPDQPRTASLPAARETVDSPVQQLQSHPQQQPSAGLMTQDSTASQPASVSADRALQLETTASQVATPAGSASTVQQPLLPGMDSAQVIDAALAAPQSSQALLSATEQEAADRAFAMAVHRQQVAEESARRKRARELMFVNDNSAKQAKSG